MTKTSPPTYSLIWERTPGTTVISEVRALELITSWRSRGSITGRLSSGEVTFHSNDGRRATISRNF
jgi:hypothetical protein